MVPERDTCVGLCVAWYSSTFMRGMVHYQVFTVYHHDNCGYYYSPARAAFSMARNAMILMWLSLTSKIIALYLYYTKDNIH